MTEPSSHWNFFSNFAHILVCLAEDPHARLRDVAERVGITERSASRLVSELDRAGILTRVKDGRRNMYVIDTGQHLRHPLEAHCTVGDMLAFILSPEKVRELDMQRRNPELLVQDER